MKKPGDVIRVHVRKYVYDQRFAQYPGFDESKRVEDYQFCATLTLDAAAITRSGHTSLFALPRLLSEQCGVYGQFGVSIIQNAASK